MMGKKRGSIIISAFFVLPLMLSAAWAADSADTIGASVSGEPMIDLQITSGESLSYADPGTSAGPYNTTLTGCPVTVVLTDNNVSAVADSAFLKLRIASSLPEQYGLGGEGKTYWFMLGTVWAPYEDNEVLVDDNTGVVSGDDLDVLIFDATGGKIIHGTVTNNFVIYVNENKRLYGDTADSITIEYTFVDF